MYYKKIITWVLMFIVALPLISISFGYYDGAKRPVVSNFELQNIQVQYDYIDMFDEVSAPNLETVEQVPKWFISFSSTNTPNRDCKLQEIRWYDNTGARRSFDVTFDDKAYWRIVGITDIKGAKMVLFHECYPLISTVTIIKKFKV